MRAVSTSRHAMLHDRPSAIECIRFRTMARTIRRGIRIRPRLKGVALQGLAPAVEAAMAPEARRDATDARPTTIVFTKPHLEALLRRTLLDATNQTGL